MSKIANEEFANGINPNASSEPLECEIKVSLQPLRINIDQVKNLEMIERMLIEEYSRMRWFLCEISLPI